MSCRKLFCIGDMLESVFRDLAIRLPKETHLSDVTWAIARNCDEFLAALEREIKHLKAYLQTVGVLEVKRRGRKPRAEKQEG